MSDYIVITDYAAKDALLTGNPAKLVKGTEIKADFDAVAVAVATKHDSTDIGVAVQAYDSFLTSIATLGTAADKMIYTTAANTAAESAITTAGRALIDDATASDQLTTLGVSAFAKTILDDADEATFKATVNLEIGTDVQAYDADTLKADVSDNLVVGFTATDYSAGTKTTGTFTPDPALGNFQYAVNGGAHTLAPPANSCTMIIQYTNNGSAGTITTSGFTKVSGTAPTTTNGDDFLAFITKANGFSHLAWQALQ